MTRARRHLVLARWPPARAASPRRPSPFFDEARAAVRRRGRPTSASRPTARCSSAVGAGARRSRRRRCARRGRSPTARPTRRPARREAATAAAELVAARAAVLAPPPPAPPVPAPPRPAREGLTLSPSAVELYRGCPLRYRYAMVDRVPSPPSVARSIGVAAHAALEAHYRPDGTGGDGEALVRRFAVQLKREGVAETAEGRQALARGREKLPEYHERMVRTRTRPVAVEQHFTLTVGPHRVHGRVDRIDAHPAGGHQLVDYKTGQAPRTGRRRARRVRRPGAAALHARRPRGVAASSLAAPRWCTSSTGTPAGCTPRRATTPWWSRRCARRPRASPPSASSPVRRGRAESATSR